MLYKDINEFLRIAGGLDTCIRSGGAEGIGALQQRKESLNTLHFLMREE